MKTFLSKHPAPPVVVLSLLSFALLAACRGHDGKVHVEITDSAFKSSTAVSQFINAQIGSSKLSASPPQIPVEAREPIEWLRQGSFMEDEETYGGPTLRCLDHFYTLQEVRTAGENAGLTDDTEPRWNPIGIGIFKPINNSFLWASANAISGPASVGLNLYNWPHARDYEYAALTSSSKGAREDKAALMLYALGHVLHLNQDLSQPDHVRNDNHNTKSKRAIGNYGETNYRNNPAWFAAKPRGWT